ncbi:hypothetical protein [uncultured Salegentibacter sp.]|uniref:hypothetical protein n=1 Tax=uncultured Salegentibacter sp. TaxID=259320 RepID=UPI0030DA6211
MPRLFIVPLLPHASSQLDKATILRLLNDGLSDRNIVKRLFEEQMNGNVEFPEAENIIWDLSVSENEHYKITTSGNLIKKDEIIASEWEKEIEENSEK